MKKEFYKDNISVIFESDHFLRIIKKHLKNQNTETGGILCGNYSEDLFMVEITEVCKPTEDSKFGKSHFIRGIKGLTLRLTKMWRNKVYYIGEWHLHPFFSAVASEQDRKQILENSKDLNLKCPEPIMIIIGMKENEFCFRVYMVFREEIIELFENKY